MQMRESLRALCLGQLPAGICQEGPALELCGRLQQVLGCQEHLFGQDLDQFPRCLHSV